MNYFNMQGLFLIMNYFKKQGLFYLFYLNDIDTHSHLELYLIFI